VIFRSNGLPTPGHRQTDPDCWASTSLDALPGSCTVACFVRSPLRFVFFSSFPRRWSGPAGRGRLHWEVAAISKGEALRVPVSADRVPKANGTVGLHAGRCLQTARIRSPGWRRPVFDAATEVPCGLLCVRHRVRPV